MEKCTVFSHCVSAGFGPSFLETGWLAQEVRFPTLAPYCKPKRLRYLNT